MAKFTPRKSAPSATNKNYIHSSKGGHNRCILITGKSCLPNCVGYAWGRWRELLGKAHNLSLGNAENWYPNTADGYKRGKTPKLGAVICWRKGQTYNEGDGAGHVAVVEEIKSNGDIVTSESVYGGERFRTRTYTKASGYKLANHVFQGFIYPPVTFELEKPKKTKAKAKYKTGDYRVNTDVLTVRKGPGTNYDYVRFNQLTTNAKEQVLANCGYNANGYVKGVECTVSEIKNEIWGKTPSGWICLDYCVKM